MTREDERGGPDQPIACAGCGALVLVKKLNPAHTAVQWTTSTAGCIELVEPVQARAMRPTCGRLRESIEAAIRDHRISVPS